MMNGVGRKVCLECCIGLLAVYADLGEEKMKVTDGGG